MWRHQLRSPFPGAVVSWKGADYRKVGLLKFALKTFKLSMGVSGLEWMLAPPSHCDLDRDTWECGTHPNFPGSELSSLLFAVTPLWASHPSL